MHHVAVCNGFKRQPLTSQNNRSRWSRFNAQYTVLHFSDEWPIILIWSAVTVPCGKKKWRDRRGCRCRRGGRKFNAESSSRNAMIWCQSSLWKCHLARSWFNLTSSCLTRKHWFSTGCVSGPTSFSLEGSHDPKIYHCSNSFHKNEKAIHLLVVSIWKRTRATRNEKNKNNDWSFHSEF